MTNFDEAYKKLNSQQKQAVDCLDGPVMVIAGPGTGKTQLLSVRVANILAKTDTLPDNILCLTFTEAASTEMRNRLASLIGQEGYDVNVMTFHAFGTEIINRFPEHFYQGANMQPIDEISSYSILSEIFSKLPHSNPLAVKYFDEYTYLSDAQRAIGQLKKAAISPEELREMLKRHQEFIDLAEPIIYEAFGDDRVSKKVIPKLEEALEKLESYSLAEPIFVSSLTLALEPGTTPPISAWKRKWLDKNISGELILKDRTRIKKLLALADVYEQYQNLLAQGYWFDYDDMVMQVVGQLSTNDLLRAELQEQYQYLLVDEFQDTNDAQLKLMRLLADNPVNEGRPNIMVVGDDDQAIYKFQGADITNMHQFSSWVDSPAVIPLTDIYRYSKPLLDLSNQVVTNVSSRLTDKIEGINKLLKAVPEHDFEINRVSFEDEFAEYDQIAKQILTEIEGGAKPESIAIIARQHSQLEKFAEYAGAKGLPLNYERRDNILEQSIIKELIHFAKVVCAIAEGDRRTANGLLPELLSYRFWDIEPKNLWKLNASIEDRNQTWLDAMLEDDKFKSVAEYLLSLAQTANNDPLNVVLDQMIGWPDGAFYKHYFSLKENKIDDQYLRLLSSLKSLKQKVVQFSGETSSLADMLKYIELQQQAKIRLVSSSHVSQSDSSVSLLSAHGAKGLEFDHVYILNAQDGVWGAGKRGQSSKLAWTSNLNIAPTGDEHDDRVRLFYVALTRAKHKLTLASARTFQNKSSLPLRLLGNHEEDEKQIKTPADELAEAYILDWSTGHHEAATSSTASLKPYLERYRLSITHLQNFVDVTSGGPTFWLISNLLKFPGPAIPAAAYGSAVHATLSEAQRYLQANNSMKPIDELMEDFNTCLVRMKLAKTEYDFYKERGEIGLREYFSQKYTTFKSLDKSEVNFYADNVMVGDAQITGLADRLNLIDGNWQTGKVEVVDYKTGKAFKSWKGKTDFEKVKLHRYKQQLLFYELMLKKSKRFKQLQITGAKLEFVEPDQNEKIVSLELEADDSDMNRLEKLVQGVWEKIQNVDLPDVSQYSADYSGILQFEEDIIKSTKS